MQLLTRKQFREAVFARDEYTCVVCSERAVDAHHLIERKLWDNGGYYADNGTSLCEIHHRQAEKNTLSPFILRFMADIDNVVLPPSFDEAKEYNKWGKEIKMPTRDDIKYPSTSYFNFSPGKDNIRESEDIDISLLLDVPLIVTIKMDGSNAKLAKNYVAARNGRQANHSSFDMLKSIHSTLQSKLSDGLLVFGEWLYAKHSIHYTDDLSLSSPFQVFGVYWISERHWFGWNAVETYAEVLGFSTVPVVGVIQGSTEWELTNKICRIAEEQISKGHEGIVVRPEYPFHYGQFEQLVGKYVRANHVQTDEHWMNQKIIRNKVKEEIK